MSGSGSGSTATESARQLMANGGALLLAYVLPRIFTAASVVVAARVLGTTDFGAYATAAALAVILSILSTLGMLPLLVREIARDPARAPRLLRAAHLLKTVANVLMLAALYVAARWLLAYDPVVVRAALALGVGYALGAYAENLAAYFQAMERMHLWTQASAAFGFVSSLVAVGLLLGTGSLVAFCWGPAVGWAVALGWLLLRAPAEVRTGVAVEPGDVAKLLRGLLPFAAAFVGLTVYCKVDVLLLEGMRGLEDAGAYTAAYKFVDVFQALVIVAAGAVYPRLSRAAVGREPGAWAGARSTEIVLLAAVPVGVALHLAAGPAVTLLFGEGYAASIPVVRTLGLLLPLLALSIHAGYVLGAAERMAWVAWLYAGGLAANVALNLVLIPRLGAPGAAWARLGSEVLLAVGFLSVLRRAAGAAPSARVLGLAAAAALLGGGAWLVPGDGLAGEAGRSVAYGLAVLVLYAGAGLFRSREAVAVRDVLRGGGAAWGGGRAA